MGFDEEEEYDEEEVEEKPVKKKPGKKVARKPEPKEQEPEEEWMVVKELPTQPVRKYKDEETGVVTNFLTIEEALTDMENKFRTLTGGL